MGKAVDINGDGTIIVVGSKDGSNGSTGNVRVFEWSGSSWDQKGSDIDGTYSGGHFGYNPLSDGSSVSISLDGSIIVGGAYVAHSNGYQTGASQVYEWNGSSWVQLGSNIIGDFGSSGQFEGFTVSVIKNSITTIVATGNPRYEESGGYNQGRVRIFQLSGGEWDQTMPFGICFCKGTLIKTDQGEIEIENIDVSKHTIDENNIVKIVKSLLDDENIVCILKNALGEGNPHTDTYVSNGHMILDENNNLVKAKTLLRRSEYDKFKSVPYNGETVYNVLLNDYELIEANGLIAESLHPSKYDVNIPHMRKRAKPSWVSDKIL
tara:strand:- start:654 stop:1616 length:963 start_codon:yes stop_codon:yes gene_type:complete